MFEWVRFRLQALCVVSHKVEKHKRNELFCIVNRLHTFYIGIRIYRRAK